MNNFPIPSTIDVIATVLFSCALFHSFLVKRFQHAAALSVEGSATQNFFRLLGEIEVVFGLWAGVLVLLSSFVQGIESTFAQLENLHFTESAFVFVILVVCSSEPILKAAATLIQFFSRMLPVSKSLGFLFAALTIGPLLGSLITEPAAMTVTSLILYQSFFTKKISDRLRYSILAVLLVNVSVGGTLTPFAAPPILMVATKWNWNFSFMMSHFGWKGILTCVLTTSLLCALFFKELNALEFERHNSSKESSLSVILIHLIFLAGIVLSSHHAVVFGGLFLFFLGLYEVTKKHQSDLKLKEGLLVAFFLAGLVVLGAPQKWWIEWVLIRLDSFALFFSAAALSAVTDNAAVTYLGAQVESLGEASKVALVSGAVVGGGLTVIANAPNPIAFGLLNSTFGEEGISPVKFFLVASVPTLIAGMVYWVL